jgi:hypothetical protein
LQQINFGLEDATLNIQYHLCYGIYDIEGIKAH